MKKWIIAGVAVFLVAAIGVGLYFGWIPLLMKFYGRNYPLEQASFPKDGQVDQIHFLATASSDAILLESNGKFALIDAGEDTEFPLDKPELEAQGWEEEVIAYLKKVAGDAQGRVTLEFVAGTHAHSDHIGGFDTVILDPDITVKQAYLKVYQPQRIRAMEIDEWDNQEVYDQMVNALRQRDVPIVSDIPEEPFAFGVFTLQFFNTGYDTEHVDIGENDNSLGLKVTKGENSAFLAGDINNKTGDEDRLGPQIGKVNLLKVGHHGYDYSTTKGFIETLDPQIAILTNYMSYAQKPAKQTLLSVSHSAIFATMEESGILAVFPDQGAITLSRNAMGAQ